MTILAVDNQYQRLFMLRECLRSVYPNHKIHGFTFPHVAVHFSRLNHVDAVFTEISMGDMDGLTLVQNVRENNKDVKIYFIDEKEVTNGDYAGIASGFLVRPVTKDALKSLSYG